MSTTITKDEYNKEIILSDEGNQVMMEWEKPYMESCIDALAPSGDVLEVGFGFGYSSTRIMEHNPQSYTIIECDSKIIEKIKQWAKKWEKICPQIPINIVKGRWQDCLDDLGEFDTIFFDDYPLDITKKSDPIEIYESHHRLVRFVDMCIMQHTNVSCKMSFYLNQPDKNIALSSNIQPFISSNIVTKKYIIPDNCNYRITGEQECSICVITKCKAYNETKAKEYTDRLKEMMNFENINFEEYFKNVLNTQTKNLNEL